jgi:hypothetical protein
MAKFESLPPSHSERFVFPNTLFSRSATVLRSATTLAGHTAGWLYASVLAIIFPPLAHCDNSTSLAYLSSSSSSSDTSDDRNSVTDDDQSSASSINNFFVEIDNGTKCHRAHIHNPGHRGHGNSADDHFESVFSCSCDTCTEDNNSEQSLEDQVPRNPILEVDESLIRSKTNIPQLEANGI